MRILSVLSTVCFIFLFKNGPNQQVIQQPPPSIVQIRSLLARLKSNEDRVRYETSMSLAKIGSEAVPLLVDASKKERGYVRVFATRALFQINHNDPIIQSTLLAVAKDKQEELEVRRYATYILGLSPSGVPTLVQMLSANDSFVRRSAVFALKELLDVSEYLVAPYQPVLTNAVPGLVAALGDEDGTVRGVASEALERLPGDVDFLLEYAINQSSNEILVQSAKEVLERRKGRQAQPESMIMEMKPGVEREMEKNGKFYYGNLGVIYALGIGGEPVRDFRSIAGKEKVVLRITFNPITNRASSSLSRFNPYEDMR